ncbi:hypothetical protein [Chromatium okenii]|jgi:hypothetical protein|nr:hypothetical protein [Chromatium okenii]MBV5311591.1 hypothetical protein [Chromatium okenii]
MNKMIEFQPGGRVQHAKFGQGVIVSLAGDYARVFFPAGELCVVMLEGS